MGYELGAGPWAVRQGGTRRESLTEHGVLIGQGMEPVNSAVLSDGQILVDQSGADPLPKTVSGDVTVDKNGATTIGAKAVTNAKIADMANNRFKGNVSGSAASPSDLSASQVLDAIGATRGSILFRGVGGWGIAVPGSAGQVWTSNGPGADPTYQDATGGGSGLSDTDRRNILLDRIYQSKMLASARRVVNALATGFKGASASVVGVDIGNSSNVDTTHLATDGYVSPTATTLVRLTGGTPTMPKGGAAANINDNNPATKGVTGSSLGNLTGASIASRIIAQIDFGSNRTIAKIEVVGYKDNGSGSNSGHHLVYSTDGSNWTQLGASITTNQTATTFSSTGSVTARYIALAVSAQSWGSITLELSDLNGYEATLDNMTLVTAAQTADASVSNGRVLIEYDASDSPTLNTDITAELTCDGGVNWTAATLAAVTANSQAGRTVAETADTACTAGASFAARVKTLNGKDVKIHGLSLTVH